MEKENNIEIEEEIIDEVEHIDDDGNITTPFSTKDIKVTNEIRNELIKTPEIIKNKNNKIYFISGDEGYYYWMYRYEVTPLKIQDWYYSDKVNLFEELKNYDYLYIKNYEEGFEEKYSNLFEEKIEKNTFYVIVKENNEIQLKKLNK